jgi:hypothetical protein
LGGGSLDGLGHVVVKTDALCGCDGEHATVFHQKFNICIACGAYDLAFFQSVPDLDGPAHALGINSKNGAGTCDRNDGSKLGHDELLKIR